jgi:hypothetical protein
MKRRAFVASVLSTGVALPAMAAQGHQHKPLSGPLAQSVVSFGSWLTEPMLDRFPNVPPAPAANAHLLLPFVATIKAGGSIVFAISGLHNIQVFAPGKRPEDVNVGLTVPMTAPPALPIINDPVDRLYRGPDPSLLPLDRVEAVHFGAPGRYLVICGFLFHFQDDMYGHVNVLP